jgi:hypothetical protein
MKRNRMEEFEIGEISGVDKPCQQPALMTIMKRAPLADPASIPSQDPPQPMSDKNPTPEQLAKALADNEALTAELAVMKAVSELPGDQRTHYDALTQEEQSEFLAKSADARAAIIAAAADDDAVIYKSTSGTEYRKSDDIRLINQAKEADELRKQLVDLAAEKAQASFEKSASDDLAHLPGELPVKVAVLKALSTLDEATHTAAMEMLKAQSASPAFETAGVTGESESDNAAAELDTLAKAYAEKNSVPLHAAYVKVMETPAGAALYNQTA